MQKRVNIHLPPLLLSGAVTILHTHGYHKTLPGLNESARYHHPESGKIAAVIPLNSSGEVSLTFYRGPDAAYEEIFNAFSR